VDVTCPVTSDESSSRIIRPRSIVAAVTTVSAAPAERNIPGSVPLRLRPIARRAEVFTDRLGARVWLRLPRAAG
jgi:hypothetical protein